MNSLHKQEYSKLRKRLLPTYRCSTVLDINISTLKKRGITTLALDLDSTLVHHGTNTIDAKTAAFLNSSGLALVVATNRFTQDSQEISDSIKPQYMHYATPTYRKPNLKYFKILLEATDLTTESVCMVGDRLLTDVWGANKAGLSTIWVDNIGPDPWYTRLFLLRPLERLIARILS